MNFKFNRKPLKEGYDIIKKYKYDGQTYGLMKDGFKGSYFGALIDNKGNIKGNTVPFDSLKAGEEYFSVATEVTNESLKEDISDYEIDKVYKKLSKLNKVDFGALEDEYLKEHPGDRDVVNIWYGTVLNNKRICREFERWAKEEKGIDLKGLPCKEGLKEALVVRTPNQVYRDEGFEDAYDSISDWSKQWLGVNIENVAKIYSTTDFGETETIGVETKDGRYYVLSVDDYVLSADRRRQVDKQQMLKTLEEGWLDAPDALKKCKPNEVLDALQYFYGEDVAKDLKDIEKYTDEEKLKALKYYFKKHPQNESLQEDTVKQNNDKYNRVVKKFNSLEDAREFESKLPKEAEARIDYFDTENKDGSVSEWWEVCYWKNRLKEDTVKQGNNWVNKGKEGAHGKFKTKKGADAQRKAMFANGYKESMNMKKRMNEDNDFYVGWHKTNVPELKKWLGSNKRHNFYRKDNGKWYLGRGRDDAYEMEVEPGAIDALKKDKFFANRMNEDFRAQVDWARLEYELWEVLEKKLGDGAEVYFGEVQTVSSNQSGVTYEALWGDEDAGEEVTTIKGKMFGTPSKITMTMHRPGQGGTGEVDVYNIDEMAKALLNF